MNNIKCPIRMAPCMGTKCEFYDLLNRRCPYGAEAKREEARYLKTIADKMEVLVNYARYRR